MPKKTKVSVTATPEEIEAFYKGSINPHDHRRLIALQMAQQGIWILAEIGKGRSTVSRWLKSYREKGMEGHGGRKPQLDESDIEALEGVLREGKYKTAKEIQHWLDTERNVKMSIWGVYYWLKKVKASHKIPRKIHAKQDPDEKKSFKENIVHKFQELDIPADRPVRIWIQDEHRYGLISTIRRCWTLRGLTKPHISGVMCMALWNS